MSVFGAFRKIFGSRRAGPENPEFAAGSCDNLFEAAHHGDSEAVETLIRNGHDVNEKSDKGATPLFLASYAGHRQIVEDLIAAGADPNLASAEQEILPLYYAALQGFAEIVDVLIGAGAEIDALDQNDYTALTIAIQAHKLEAVKRLLAAGAKIEYAEIDNPLVRCAQEESLAEMADVLIRAGADVDSVASGWPPLCHAAEYGNRDVAERLLEAGANPETIGRDGKTPLETAVEYGNDAIADLLRAHIDRQEDREGSGGRIFFEYSSGQGVSCYRVTPTTKGAVDIGLLQLREDLPNREYAKVLVDVSEAAWMASAQIGGLVAVDRAATAHGLATALVVSDRVLPVFQVTGMTTIMNIVTSREDGLELLRGLSVIDRREGWGAEMHRIHSALESTLDRHSFDSFLKSDGFVLDEVTPVGEIHRGREGLIMYYVMESHDPSRIHTLTYSPAGVSTSFTLVEDGRLDSMPSGYTTE